MKHQESYQHYLETMARSRLRLMFCRRMDEKDRFWNFTLHSHDCLEIICFLEGSLNINREEQEIEAAPGSIVIHPPHVLHQEFPRPDTHREVIALWLESPIPSAPSDSVMAVDRDGSICSLFRQIHAEYHRTDAFAGELTRLYLSSLLLLTARALTAPASGNTLTLIIHYLRQNYSMPLTLDTLASLAAVSPSYLERLFRRHLHTSPMRCLRQIRIQEAKKLLIQSAFSIEDIACRVGIPDASYFWRLFRKETGFSPSEYRRFLKNPEECSVVVKQ